jgi:predicted dehydrogenase
LIGFGFISSQGHAPAYLQRQQSLRDIEIRAIADICESRRQAAQKAFPAARVYETAEELIKQESFQLDFVDIATPPADHSNIARLALEAGLHVLCEKPLTCTFEEAESLAYLAQQQKRVLFPCHNYKHAPVVKAIREIIKSGQIGRVRSVQLNTFRNTHAKGVPDWKTHWRREHRYSGGGIAMDHGSHSFYLAFEWMGSVPLSVTAKMSNLEPQKYDTEDNFNCVLTFPNGIASFHLTWTAGVRKVIYAIQGERGAITVDDDDLQLAIQKATSGPDVAQGAIEWTVEKRCLSSHWMDASHISWFQSLFSRFEAAIINKEYISAELKEAILCIRTINLAYQSAAQNSKEVLLPEPHFFPLTQGVYNG